MKDSCSVEIALRCLATEYDGFGPNKLADGGVLAAIIAAGIKGILRIIDCCLIFASFDIMNTMLVA